MRVVNDAVQYRITAGGVGNDVMPMRHRDQERSFVLTVINDLEDRGVARRRAAQVRRRSSYSYRARALCPKILGSRNSPPSAELA
jgi:hypothetical protein